MQKWAKDNKRDVKPRAEGREFPAVSGFFGLFFCLVRIYDVLISTMDVDFRKDLHERQHCTGLNPSAVVLPSIQALKMHS